VKMDFKWNKPIPKIAKEVTGGDRTLLFMANEAKRLMDPYVPAKNLVLARNVRTYVEGGRELFITCPLMQDFNTKDF